MIPIALWCSSILQAVAYSLVPEQGSSIVDFGFTYCIRSNYVFELTDLLLLFMVGTFGKAIPVNGKEASVS
jgi:hypothetical protein